MIKTETARAGESVKGISEYRDRRICSYLLDESVHLSHAGYYRMKKKLLPFLLPCYKVCYNGKIKLIYQTGEKIALCEMIENLTQNQWDHVIEQLLCAIHVLKSEAYFQFGQIELEAEKIYMDLENYRIYVIYLPVYQEKQAMSIQVLEEEIKQKLENLYKKYQKDTESFVLQRIGSAQNETWKLEKGSFVIGKQKTGVQGVISDSKALSRKHCKLFWEKGQWWLMDLESKNGTFLNKMRLIPNQWYAVQQGDRIFAADCEFHLLCSCFKEKGRI